MDVADILPHGVGGALIPVGRLVGLLGGEDFNKAFAERIELVGVGDVAVQADAQELSQDVDAVAVAVDAIADGNIDQAILPADGNRRLAAQHGERVKTGPAPAAQNQAQDFTVHDVTCEFHVTWINLPDRFRSEGAYPTWYQSDAQDDKRI